MTGCLRGSFKPLAYIRSDQMNVRNINTKDVPFSIMNIVITVTLHCTSCPTLLTSDSHEPVRRWSRLRYGRGDPAWAVLWSGVHATIPAPRAERAGSGTRNSRPVPPWPDLRDAPRFARRTNIHTFTYTHFIRPAALCPAFIHTQIRGYPPRRAWPTDRRGRANVRGSHQTRCERRRRA